MLSPRLRLPLTAASRWMCTGVRLDTPCPAVLTQSEVDSFHRDGYVIREGMFTEHEMTAIFETAKTDVGALDKAHARLDAEGRASKLSLMNTVGANAYGAVARSSRMLRSVEKLLGGESYHYHSKVMLKEAVDETKEVSGGGAWEWHQDFGYWMDNNLFPRMLSAMLAIDTHTRANGCLQVLKGSHVLGRLDHTLTGEQAGVSRKHLEAAQELFEVVHVEATPGTVLFFHCNTLHASSANLSPHPRWSLISAWNRAPPAQVTWPHHHPQYEPIDEWGPDEVAAHLRTPVSPSDGTVFMDHEADDSASRLVDDDTAKP